MEGQTQRAGARRRRRRSKKNKNKGRSNAGAEPVLIAARRPDSPLLSVGKRRVVASARPKYGNGAPAAEAPVESSATDADPKTDAGSPGQPTPSSRRRAVRIVRAPEKEIGKPNREQILVDRLLGSQGRGAISRAADDLWECDFEAPKDQKVQIQLLEHENETRARDAVFAMAELLQREAPIQRPILDQRLRRLEEFADDPITRDAAGALRRSVRVHYGA